MVLLCNETLFVATCHQYFVTFKISITSVCNGIVTVLDPKKGVCADPVGRDAILGVEGPGPPVGVSERQLSPDRGGEKT